MIPYLFSEGLIKKRLNLSTYLQISSENAAKKYGFFDKKGSIEIGKEADFYIIDPAQEFVVCGNNFYSKGKLTPFENTMFTGKLIKTFVRGIQVYDCNMGIIAQPGTGKFIYAKT